MLKWAKFHRQYYFPAWQMEVIGRLYLRKLFGSVRPVV